MNYAGSSILVGGTCRLSKYVLDDSNQTLSNIMPPSITADGILCSVSIKQNTNMTSAQREILAWHFRMGHIFKMTLQRLIRPKSHSIC